MLKLQKIQGLMYKPDIPSDLLFITHKINLMKLYMQYCSYSRWLPSNNHLFALIEELYFLLTRTSCKTEDYLILSSVHPS